MPVSQVAATLRPVCGDDEPFLLAVYAGTRAAEMALVDWDPSQKDAFVKMQFEAQRQHYARVYPQLEHWIVERDGHDLGRMMVAELADEFRLVDLALLPEHCGRGTGGALMRDLMARAAAAGKAVRLHVEIFNPALRLYERLGFTKVDEQGLYRLMEWREATAQKTTAPADAGARP